MFIVYIGLLYIFIFFDVLNSYSEKPSLLNILVLQSGHNNDVL